MNLLQHYYIESREWLKAIGRETEVELECLNQQLETQHLSEDIIFDTLVDRDCVLREIHHTKLYENYFFYAKKNLIEWAIQVHDQLVLEGGPILDPQNSELVQEIRTNPMYQVRWQEMCEKTLKLEYPYLVALPDDHLAYIRSLVFSTREMVKSPRAQVIRIELAQAEGASLEKRVISRSGYGCSQLLPERTTITHLYHETYESADDIWIRANDILQYWTKDILDDSSYQVDFALLFDDGSRYDGTTGIGQDWEALPALEAHIRSYCTFYAGRRQPQSQHREKYLSLIKAAQDQLQHYEHILDKCQLGPEGV